VIIVVWVTLTMRGIAVFFRRVLGWPYPRWYEGYSYAGGTALLVMVLGSWTGITVMWLAIVAAICWTAAAEWRPKAKKESPGDPQRP
jgi:hypothetical protein